MDRFTRYLFRDKVIILTYHGFTQNKYAGGLENGQGKHLYIGSFDSHLKYLKEYYNIVHLESVADFYKRGAGLPKKTVVITIDDGYRSNYTLAYPLLKRYGLPAAIFLTTDFVDKMEPLWVDRVEYALNNTEAGSFEFITGGGRRVFDLKNAALKKSCEKSVRNELKKMERGSRDKMVRKLEKDLRQRLDLNRDIPEIYRPLTWSDISTMTEEGLVSVGSHTRGHVIMSRCSGEEAKDEAFLSKDIIEEKTKRICRLFSYPNGAAGDFNDGTKKILTEAGYACAVTNMAGLNDKRSDAFALRRFGMSKTTDLAEFKRILAGIARLPGYVKQSFLMSAGR